VGFSLQCGLAVPQVLHPSPDGHQGSIEVMGEGQGSPHCRVIAEQEKTAFEQMTIYDGSLKID